MKNKSSKDHICSIDFGLMSPISRLVASSLLLFLVALPGKIKAADENSWPYGNTVRALLVPVAETTLASELAGRLKEIKVDIGDSFKKDQPLIIYDCEMYRAELDKAKADYAEAEKTLEVNKRLKSYGSVSDLDYAIAQARADRAKAELNLRQAQVDKCVVTAPFSGRVIKREANTFQFVTPGQPLIQIIDDIHLNLQMFVPSLWLSWLQTGEEFFVTIDETEKKYQARVTVLGAKIDPVSQSLEIRAEIVDKSPELLAGMSGTAVFKVPGK